jgi:site-specific DNA recombinase
MTLRAAIYARVSTPNQTQAQTIEQQLERLKEYAKQQDYSIEEQHIFLDDGRSGATLNRSGLDHLRDVIRQGEVDCVLIASPDRLARNYVHQMILLDEAAHYGCLIEFLDRPMSQDPHDKLLLQIRGAVAEYERALITDRMRRGRLAKYQAGTLLPWTRPPYGYRLGVDHPRDPREVRINEFEVAVVQEIYELYVNDGVSLCSLAKHLQQQGIPTPSGKGIWGLATLRGILRQPTYTGKVYAMRYHYRPARVRRSATHEIGIPHSSAVELPPEDWVFVAEIPPIISQEVFDLAQASLARNKSFAARNNKSHQYLLRALVSCGMCQSSCVGRTLEHGKYSYYVCAGKANPIHSRREEKCSSRFAPSRQLDDLVWQDLCAVITHPEQITDALRHAHSSDWLPQELQARRGALRQVPYGRHVPVWKSSWID